MGGSLVETWYRVSASVTKDVSKLLYNKFLVKFSKFNLV